MPDGQCSADTDRTGSVGRRAIHVHLGLGMYSVVMAGLVPAIHEVFPQAEQDKTWKPGTRPGMTKG
jgi:hypothetical protein